MITFSPAFLAASVHQPLNLAVAMLIIFGTAKLLAELFERLGIPGIVGEILAGILIGPSVLGWISPDEFTTAMAGLGVMFLLFRVGLEVDSGELIKLGGTSLTVGVLGVAVPFLSGMGFYLLWGMPRMESIFLGTALTATSVGITAQVLSSRGLLHRTASKIILGAAVIDDILALLLLGFVTSLAEGRVHILELGLTSGLAVVFIVLIARWGKHTMGRVVARLEGRLRVGEGEFALAMVLLFGLAALSTWIGVAAIIGAFLAGMTLSGSSPRRVHDLAQGVTELLVPFFLAGVGLHLNLGVFRDSRTVALALLLVPIAVISKMLACGLGAARFGPQIAMRVGAGMIPRGEFCMVVAQVGLTLKAISDATFAIVVFMAVVAAALAPPLLRLAFRAVLNEVPPVQETPNLW